MPAEYRELAAECLPLSSVAHDPDAKAHNVTIAQAWVALAIFVESRFHDLAEAASSLVIDRSG